MQQNAGKHLKYIKIWVAEVEGCNLYVNMGFMEVMNDIEVPICRKKSAKCTIESQFLAIVAHDGMLAGYVTCGCIYRTRRAANAHAKVCIHAVSPDALLFSNA